jgi:hypothetical protein
MAPDAAEYKSKDRVPIYATYKWIVDHFTHCPVGDNEDHIKTYTPLYAWYVISRNFFC